MENVLRKCPVFIDHYTWERGLNENTNGLIRQYFTKGSSFENITDEQVEEVMNKLNHRPRKKLNYKTPNAVFFSNTECEAAWMLELHFGVESAYHNTFGFFIFDFGLL